MGTYSPQFDADTYISQAKFGHPGSSSSCITENPGSNTWSVGSSARMEQSGSTTPRQDEGTIYSENISDRAPEVIRTPSVEGENCPRNEHCGQQKISVADVMCTACKHLPFRPLVLNCGHVYCETCIVNSTDKMLRCQICQSSHPRGLPKVCLELDHFLEEQFPEEYAERRDAVKDRRSKGNPEMPSSCIYLCLLTLLL